MPDPDPKISVIIPVYNSAELLAYAVESVLKQNFALAEIIIVDDGSTDSTFIAAKELEEANPNVRAFNKSNGGASSARNFGFRQVSLSSQFLFFLDADDRLLPNALILMHAYLDENKNVGLLGCQFNYIDYNSNKIIPARRTRICKPGLIPRDLKDKEYETPFEVFYCATGQGPYALYRRSIFEKTNGWSEDFWGHNDTDMFIQMALEAPVHYLPHTLYLKKKVKTSLEHQPNRGKLYKQLRAKWDNYTTDDIQKSNKLSAARYYYYRWHRPCRDLKVSTKALISYLREPTLNRLQWFFKLLRSGFSGLLFPKMPKD